MSQVKEAILSIRTTIENKKSKLIDLVAPWMIITDLELNDVIDLSYNDLVAKLSEIHETLSRVVDILDEDQLREAACRSLKTITVVGEPLPEGVGVFTKHSIVWDGSSWSFNADSKTRQIGKASLYMEALKQVREIMSAS